MMINPSSVRATFGDAVSNIAANTASNPATDPAGFASLLRRTLVAPARAPAAPAEAKPATGPAPANDAKHEAPASQESDATSRARALKGKPRTTGVPVPPREPRPTLDARDTEIAEPAEPTLAESIDKTDRTDGTDKTDETVAGDCKAAETRLTTGDAPIDPSVMHWLAGLQRAAASQPDDTRAGADDKTMPVDTDTDTDVIESRGAAKGSRAAELRAEAELTDRATQRKMPLADAAVARPFAAALTEHGGTVEKPSHKVIDAPPDVATAGASTLAPSRTAGNDAPAPTAVAIATPVTAPDFAQTLGLRLAVLAKDGVQTAELHLNPADMGPVSVQIVMDGTQARVDFGADMAATRRAIESGLPELASALRDAGFTLAGGGVSQHAGGRRGGNEPGASEGRRERGIAAEDDMQRVAATARRIVTNGGVDVFA